MLAPVGAGGMGEVYRARDTRLSREVAIKVLPSELASDASRLRRFEKEARSASALNHPNIVTVYDIGSENGLSYIAMERVEGETLRKLIVGGALATRKLLPIATQIADGRRLGSRRIEPPRHTQRGRDGSDGVPHRQRALRDGRRDSLPAGFPARRSGSVPGQSGPR
ncbi:MAG: protein kinase [Thermoanaerobaculia bacterium]